MRKKENQIKWIQQKEKKRYIAAVLFRFQATFKLLKVHLCLYIWIYSNIHLCIYLFLFSVFVFVSVSEFKELWMLVSILLFIRLWLLMFHKIAHFIEKETSIQQKPNMVNTSWKKRISIHTLLEYVSGFLWMCMWVSVCLSVCGIHFVIVVVNWCLSLPSPLWWSHQSIKMWQNPIPKIIANLKWQTTNFFVSLYFTFASGSIFYGEKDEYKTNGMSTYRSS